MKKPPGLIRNVNVADIGSGALNRFWFHFDAFLKA